MNMQTPVVKEQSLIECDRWTEAEITRIRATQYGTFELSFKYSFQSKREGNGAFLGIMRADRVDCNAEMERFEFVGFLASIGFDGNATSPALFTDRSPLLGFKFDAKLRIKGTHDGDYSSIITSNDRWLKVRLLDAAPSLDRDLNEVHDLAIMSEVAQSHRGPIFYAAASYDEFADAGYRPSSLGRYNAGSDKFIRDYDRRSAIFDGQTFNGSSWKGGNRKRVAMLVPATHKSDPDRSHVFAPSPHGKITTFLCLRHLDGLHIMFPIWEGQPFWSPDKSDADVIQILGEARRMKQPIPAPPPPTPPT